MEDIELKDRLIAAKSYHETAQSASVSTNYPLTEVFWAGATKFVGELVIAANEEQGLMLFTDGELQSSQSDERIYHEFAVHPTILLHRHLFGDADKPLKVLVLGGGEGATVRELVKYSSEHIGEVIWNDIDKDLCDLCDKFIGYSAGYMQEEVTLYDSGDSKKRVKIMYEDANALLKEECHQGRYDVIINDLPDPGENDEGLYSPEFFADLYKCCAEKSVIVSHAGPVSPTHMQVKNFLKDNLCKAGFEEEIKFGLVAIPSFQSEWGYVYSYKTPTPIHAIGDINYASALEKHGPPAASLHIVDQHSLRRFFDIPPYYFK